MKYAGIETRRIKCDPEQNISRESLTPEECADLAQDINNDGIITPPTVIPCPDEGYDYEVAVGFRRFTAMTVNLGWDKIPVVVADWTREEARLKNIKENLLRNDLSFWEECRALMLQFASGTTHMEIAQQLSKSETWVKHRWLDGFPQEVIDQVKEGLLGPSHIGVIVVQKTKEEKIAAAARLKAGQEQGETIRDIQRELTGRKNNRSKKQVKAAMSRCLELGSPIDMAAVHMARFATGEISDTLMFEYLDKLRNA
jgi:ParB family chromosome partitioning protein